MSQTSAPLRARDHISQDRYRDGHIPLVACCGKLLIVRSGGAVCPDCGTVWTVPPADCSGGWGDE